MKPLIIPLVAIICVSFVVAIANPASTFCVDQGYKLQMRSSAQGQYGVCVFPDKVECEEWKFFRGECGKEYQKEFQCKKAGEELRSAKCCKGLSQIRNDAPDTNGVCRKAVGGWDLCSACGDGVCDSWENYCNCPKDCKKEACVREGASLGPVVPGNEAVCCAGLMAKTDSKKLGSRGVCVKTTKCQTEGQPVQLNPSSPVCCAGLTMIKPKQSAVLGIKGICTAKCGNSVCDKQSETKFNCPRDCKK